MLRSTEDVLKDLKRLILSEGFIYSFCIILFEEFHLDINKIHEVDYRSKLSIKECSLILGFLVQNQINFAIPSSPEEVFSLRERAYELMEELHNSFNAPMLLKMSAMLEKQSKGGTIEDTRNSKLDFFAKDSGLVEPMFYAGDGVYDFQYVEYLEPKYKYDIKWLNDHKEFDINSAKKIVVAIKENLQAKALTVRLIDLKKEFPIIAKKARKDTKGKFSTKEMDEIERQNLIAATFYQYVKLFPAPNAAEPNSSEGWKKFYENLLELFIISPSEFEQISHQATNAFFRNFSFVTGCNEHYNGPGHFNILNSRPIIKLSDSRYFVPINYLVAEAVYETPYYWMAADKGYTDKLAQHRGEVGEEIAYNFLSKVFGANNTYRSVIVQIQKGQRATDIDVLCILGTKALCVQVKSKKLTLMAKRGDFEQLSRDFKGAVQDAYDQGLASREAILKRTAKFINSKGEEIDIPKGIDEVFIMGLTTENYPSLVHQVDLMLAKVEEDPYPLFLSVFDLELLVHYLHDPYDFLYYVRQRVCLLDYFKADEEMMFLGYHLDQKLWKIDGYTGGLIDTDFGGIIDRNYYPYKTGISHLLPESDDPIQNRWRDPQFDFFLEQIKLSGHPKTTDIVFQMLDWSGNARKEVVDQITKLKIASIKEGDRKSLATAVPPTFGISYVVTSNDSPLDLRRRTSLYAKLRKYHTKCNKWLAIGTFADSPNLIDFLEYDDEIWKMDYQLEHEYKDTFAMMKQTKFTPMKGAKKLGRNDQCPCKSGQKYKKCCGH